MNGVKLTFITGKNVIMNQENRKDLGGRKQEKKSFVDGICKGERRKARAMMEKRGWRKRLFCELPCAGLCSTW